MIFRRSSVPGRRFGNGISDGQPMERISAYSRQPRALIRGLTQSWPSCSRWIQPAFARTSMRLAPCAARTQRARSNYTKLENEPTDHAIGRSRGGLTTKVHALTDALVRPVSLLLTSGQAGDNPALEPLLDAYRIQENTKRGFTLLADKAYSHPSTRARLRKRRIKNAIPERIDQKQHRKDKGQQGGRPPRFDRDLYKKRNTVERGFSRFKQWRGIATRYDKYALTYQGGVLLAAIILHHKPI
ncbi:transposase [Rhodoglobus vestalii]|uniref:Transposase n=1 Tax=Rhodoglobus vestalii TaxID=193384 RepID=A0A8H2K620_9MICO|nr:transposase [Rhodoglobus vestalii]